MSQKDYTYYYASAILHIYIDSENLIKHDGKGLNIGSRNFAEPKLITANEIPHSIKYKYIKLLLP